MRHLGPLNMRRIARGMAGLGRSSLLLAWLVTGSFGTAAHAGGLLREVYTDIPGARLDDLFNSAKYPDRPDLTEILPEFEAPTDVMDDYGQRLRGFLVPPVTGDYVFWIAGDDESVLYLSSTTSPADAVDIAAVPDWTSSREWTKYPSQQSGVIWLDASRMYYIEALMKEGGGGDNLAVRWQLPGGAIEEPIPEARLVPFGTVLTPPVIRTQPSNQAVVEGQPAVFSVSVNNPDPVHYQWQRGGAAIPGATSASYTLPSARLADHGASFRCTITNSLGSALSAAAALSVQPDVAPPLLRQAHNVGARTVVVTFSEPVDSASAAVAGNYRLDQGRVLSAQPQADARLVSLQVDALEFGRSYLLTVDSLKDRSVAGNLLAPNSRIGFVASILTASDLGEFPEPGTAVSVPGGFDITAMGSGLGDWTDRLHFSYQERAGDFDVRVRVAAVELTDVWATAGLMARALRSTNGPMAGVFATPSISGVFFASRGATNPLSISPSMPVNYPYTWLRLRRNGDLFTGYSSYDGEAWRTLRSVTNPMPALVYLGLSVSSQQTNRTLLARFREFSDVVSATEAARLPDVESLGPSSRRTPLVISEIMYNPIARADGADLEYVELFNSQPVDEPIGGFRLSGSIDYTFPPNSRIDGGGFVVVAKEPSALKAASGLPTVYGPYENNLPGDGGRVTLHSELGAVLIDVDYSDRPPWPASADGAGHSLILARPSLGEGRSDAWSASLMRGGSPGAMEPFRLDAWGSIKINEFLAHTDDPALDFIELYNAGARAVDLGGAFLSDSPDVGRFRIPNGTPLPPGGFIQFTQNDLGFALSSSGETICLVNPDQTQVIDAVRFGPQANGIASGRYPDGAPGIHELRTPTPGRRNDGLRINEIVINEIMFHPAGGNDADEYVELHNRGLEPADLSHWRFVDGIDFAFPPGVTIPGGGYIVVAKDAARLRSNHPALGAGAVVGDYQGQLANGGERLALARPSDPSSPLADLIVVDEVAYGEGGRWGRWADGDGSSLELVDARSDNRLAANWAVSDETAKSAWVAVEHTGVLDLGTEVYGVDRLQILLMGEGECLIDDVQVIGPNGNNLVPNSTFEQDAQGWRARGTHARSNLETTEGYRSGKSLRLRASGRGSTDANHVFIDLTGSLAPGTYATLRARARWCRGNPELLLRLRGNHLEAPGRLPVPLAAGTPGARNSTARANTGPALWDIKHSPILPAIGQSVLVTARAHDPDGLMAVECIYRIDPSSQTTRLPMRDDGAGGDVLGGDGLYSAVLPPQNTTNLVAFAVEASDAATTRAASRYPVESPERECLVRWGEETTLGNLGTYRIWMTRATLSQWETREPSSNDPLPVTFVHGHERVVYGASALYSGSPFHWGGYDSPMGLNCNYVLLFPKDDRFLGATDFVLNLPANLGSDRSAQREQFFFAMARAIGRPHACRRFCHLIVNGLVRGPIFEDAQQPNRDYVEQWFPDDAEGELFKIEDWFDYDDTILSFQNVDATLERFTTTDGDYKLARYRWNWRKRAVRDSAHDYARLFELVDALNASPSEYTTRVENLVDVDGWMRTFALRHAAGDWDSYGYRRGKNMYAYRPVHGRWQLLDWDVAFAFGLGDGTTQDLFDAQHSDGSIDAVTERMYNHPPFRRAYLRALYDIAHGPLEETWARQWLGSTYTALADNALAATSPDTILTWIRNRRLHILGMLATNAVPFAITSNGGIDFAVQGNNLVKLEGTAPVQMQTLRVNGRAYPVTWTSVTGWRMDLPLRSGANLLKFEGYGSTGVLIPGAAATLRIDYAGPDQNPRDYLVISEIHYHPDAPDTGFVEIHNMSATHAFDLTGFELRGAGFAFAEGTVIEPGAYLVVVTARSAFGAEYGYQARVAGVLPGRLQNDGETLSLVRAGATPAQDVLIDRVTYDDAWPWPAAADGEGSSLQLIDLTEDNRRPGAWVAVTNDPSTTGWKFAQTTGIASGGSLYFYLESSGEVFLDDVWLAAGPLAETGTNLVKNAGFEQPLAGSWIVSDTDPDSRIESTLSHSGDASMRLVSETGGNTLLPSLGQANLAVRPGDFYTLSFWYHPTPTGGGLTAGLLGSALELTVSLVPGELPLPLATPGAPNVLPGAFTPLPPLWINEVMPNNLSGPRDRFGDADPWIELFNAGGGPVSLDGLFLAHNGPGLLEWPFPSGLTIDPGQRLVVWADGEPGESSPEELHANLRLDPVAGAIALSIQDGAAIRVVDSLRYADVFPDRSWGSWPEGDPDSRRVLHYPTPGASNDPSSAPVVIYVNEWMAANRTTVADPADQDTDDWFELHNPSDVAVDLSGYSVTDDLGEPRRWVLPSGTVIPARGHLLIWADDETEQNAFGLGLHASFRLSQEGESLGLFAPDGTQVDAVTLGPQEDDVSEGRYPDGAPPPFIAMTTPTPGGPNVAPGPSAPRAISIEFSGAGIAVRWAVQPGQTYRVEFTDDPVESAWQAVGGPAVATQSVLEFVDPIDPERSQGFYRLILLP